MTLTPTSIDRTEFLLSIRDAVVNRFENVIFQNMPVSHNAGMNETVSRLRNAQILYGIGSGSYRGICYFSSWSPGPDSSTVDTIEIAATGEESYVQLACTLVHELGHVLAGVGEAHGPVWKAAATALGLRKPRQAGQTYYLASLVPELRLIVSALISQLTGGPAFTNSGAGGYYGVGFVPTRSGPCRVGQKRQVRNSSGPIITYQCECRVRIKTDANIFVRSDGGQLRSDIECKVCLTEFVPISNGKRGRPRKSERVGA